MDTDSLDANLIIRFLTNDIPGQRDAVKDYLANSPKIHHISTVAISEIVYVLEKSYKRPRPVIGDLLLFFLTHYSDIIEYNHELIKKAFPLYLSHPKLSFNDCLLAAEAEAKSREPLITFDKKLAAQLPQAKLLKPAA